MRSDFVNGVDAIVLAGSYHWTGSSFEELRPRPLLPVAQKPLVEYVLEWLRDGGVSRTIICANGSTGAIRSHLGNGAQHALDIRYHEDGSPRGAAGCAKDAAVLSVANTLIVADGTSIPVLNLPDLLEHHRNSGAVLTIAVHQKDGKSGSPSVQPAGVYVFEREVLDEIPATSFQDIKESLIPRLYRAGRPVSIFAVDAVSPRVLNGSSYLAANHWMIRRAVAAARKPGAKDDVVADPSAWVSPDAILVGPVILGPGVRVQAGATVVGPTSLGAGTVVGRNAVVARSVTWTNCSIGERAVVDQSLLADNVAADDGAVLFNAIRSRPPQRGIARFVPGERHSKAGTRQPLASPAVS